MTDDIPKARNNVEHTKEKVQELRLKNKEAILEVKKLHANAKTCRELRDAENAKVKEAKIKWQAQEKEAAIVRSELEKAKKQIETIPKGRSPGALQAELEQLEWVQQTEALSQKEEREMSKKIKEIIKILPEAKKASRSFDAISGWVKTLREINEKAKHARQEMNEHAKKSDAHHQTFLKAVKKADSLSKKITEKFKELDEKRATLSEQLGERRQMQKEHRDQERKEMDALKKEQDALDAKIKAKATGLAEKAIEKFKKGGKLSMQDIQAIQASGMDLTS